VGDTVRFKWREIVEDEEGAWTPIDYDEDVVIVEAEAEYGEAGERTWQLTLSSTALLLPSDADQFAALTKRLNAVQAFQV